MGRLLRMKLLYLQVFFYQTVFSSSQKCYNLTNAHESQKLNLSRQNISILSPENCSTLTNYIEIDLSNNQLQILPDYLISPNLTKVYLQHNNFKDLPDKFWNHTCLEELQLEENPLSSIRGSVICNTTKLKIDCRCDITKSVIKHHCLSSNCPKNFRCILQSQQEENITEFYEQTCQGLNLLPLYITFALLVAVGLVVLAIRGIKGNSETNSSKQDADSATPQEQPRYISSARSTSAAINLSRDSSYEPTPQHKDYENVLIGPLQSEQGQNYSVTVQPAPRYTTTKNEDFYMQCDAYVTDQPVYSNTDPVYYDYSSEAATAPQDDDVYILPDQ